ncbi:MAG: hypothetical protein K2L07_14075 [Lachnospiraceae bacterium]|nr:hypothetical protein [Lachnospiraceae bacterium]
MANIELGKQVGHLISANLEDFNFDELIEEYNRDKSILWHNGREEGKGAQQYNVGDECFFYYTNLPDFSRRIVLRGVVSDDNAVYDEKKKIKGIRIKEIYAVSLKNKSMFSYDELIKEYDLSWSFRGKRYLYSIENEKLLLALRNAVESENSLKEIREYFNGLSNCDLSNGENIHPTFEKKNGLKYFEIHHLVQSHIYKSFSEYKYAIKDDNNKFHLCATCHRQIHSGKNEDIKERIKILYETNKKWYDDTFFELAKKQGFLSVLEWIYSTYKL